MGYIERFQEFTQEGYPAEPTIGYTPVRDGNAGEGFKADDIRSTPCIGSNKRWNENFL
jgi:hypothetical protein